MKKVLAIIIAALFVFALASVSFAVEKKAAPVPVPAPAKAEEKAVEKKAPTKVKQITGEVTSCDTKTMTITVSKKVKGKAVKTVVTVDNSSSTENGPNREGQKIRSFIHKGLEEGEVEISKNRSDNKMKML